MHLTKVGSTFSHRYASLYFAFGVDEDDNELLMLEVIHRYVELLDKYFESVRFAYLYDRLADVR